MFNNIEELKAHVEHLKTAPPYEINEHLATLQRFGSECERICEFGIGWFTSTLSLMSAQPKWMRSYDSNPEYEQAGHKAQEMADGARATAAALGIDFKLTVQDSGAEDFVIDECDLLFIDSLHNGWHVKKELTNHAHKVKKYIIFHDTQKYGTLGQDGGPPWRDLHPDVPGLNGAIDEFMAQNPEWQVKERYSNCNGLLVIGK
jgi:hypothetical protein